MNKLHSYICTWTVLVLKSEGFFFKALKIVPIRVYFTYFEMHHYVFFRSGGMLQYLPVPPPPFILPSHSLADTRAQILYQYLVSALSLFAAFISI